MQFLITGNTSDPDKATRMASLVMSLQRRGIAHSIEPDFAGFLHDKAGLPIDPALLTTDDTPADAIAMSIGGDGTFLRTARMATARHIPVIGVNMGRMGFLTDIEPATFEQATADIAAGGYHIEERAQLELSIDGPDGPRRATALNDIAVMKMDISAMVTIEVMVNGQFLSNYQCDGLILATSTGSTAYSLSVGGPIIMPQSMSMVLTPVAPHNLSLRPIVMPGGWTVQMAVKSRNRQFLVSVDGESMACDESDRLTIAKAKEAVRIVKLDSHPLFENLRSKLMLGIDGRTCR